MLRVSHSCNCFWHSQSRLHGMIPHQALIEPGRHQAFPITNVTLPHIIPRQRKAAHGRGEPASANGTRLTAEGQTGVETMSGCRQRKLRLSFAPSPPQCEAGQIDTHPKDRWRDVMFPLDI